MIGILIFNCTKKSWNCHCFGCLPCPCDTREHDNLEPFLSESLPQVALFSFWLLDFVLFSWYNLSPQLCIRIQCVALAHGSSDSCFEVNNMHHATSSFFIHILQKYNSNRRFDLCSYVGDVSWAPYSRYPSTCPHTPDHHNTPPVCPIFWFTLRQWDLLWSLLRAPLTVSKLALSLPPCRGMAGSLCLTSPQTSTLLSAGYSLLLLESGENDHQLGGKVQESFMFHYL